jgi:CRISPR-associated endonuclease/helicase Cas3
VRGIDEGDGLPECEIATGIRVPGVRLSLRVMETGAAREYGISWTERVIRLRDKLGPFRLAFLEMLLRAADERASRVAEEAACTH